MRKRVGKMEKGEIKRRKSEGKVKGKLGERRRGRKINGKR